MESRLSYPFLLLKVADNVTFHFVVDGRLNGMCSDSILSISPVKKTDQNLPVILFQFNKIMFLKAIAILSRASSSHRLISSFYTKIASF